MDGIILIILVLIVCFYFRDFYKIVNAVAIIDIFLRIFYFVVHNVEIRGISEYVEKYLPESVPAIILNYKKVLGSLMCNLLIWVYVIIMGIFLFYTVKRFIKSK